MGLLNTLQAMDESAIAFTARSADDGLSGGDRVDLDMPYCCHEVCSFYVCIQKARIIHSQM